MILPLFTVRLWRFMDMGWMKTKHMSRLKFRLLNFSGIAPIKIPFAVIWNGWVGK